MRKLRRLPWRIPKSNSPRPPERNQTCAAPELGPRIEAEKDKVETLPVAFAGGRYVSSVHRPTEIRRKSPRHRLFGPIPAVG